MACAILALYLGREFIDWMWGFYLDCDDDDPDPTPLLRSTMPVWWKLDMLGFRLWHRLWWPVRRWLENNLPRVFPVSEPLPTPMDSDGRTPEEWLAIEVIGVWNLEWYEGAYDKRIKENWEDFLKSREVQGNHESQVS